jgi:hypothetical protein
LTVSELKHEKAQAVWENSDERCYYNYHFILQGREVQRRHYLPKVMLSVSIAVLALKYREADPNQCVFNLETLLFSTEIRV